MAQDQQSPDPGPQAPADSATVTGVDAAQSSSAEQATPPSDGDTREALLEAVQQAVPDGRPRPWSDDDASVDGTPPSARTTDQAADSGAAEADLTKDELKQLSPRTQKHIKRLIAERKGNQDEIARLKSYEPIVQTAKSVEDYLRANDIGQEDFLSGMKLMGALRQGDFRTFYAGIKPYYDLAEQYLGISLAPDLQQSVREGHMTTQAAQMFSRERMDRAMTQNNLHRQQQAFGAFQQQATAQQQQQQRAQLAETIRTGVNAWEAKIEQSDPDYAQHKRAAVQNMMWSVVNERGRPQSPEHAIAIAQESLRRVNQLYSQWAPQRRPTMRVPSSTARNPGVQPEPKNLADVIRTAHQTFGSARL
jgi:hypothetical protein